jgi:bacillithiol system protein YtxJ
MRTQTKLYRIGGRQSAKPAVTAALSPHLTGAKEITSQDSDVPASDGLPRQVHWDRFNMPIPLRTLSTTAELDLALEQSSVRPVVIFKHSPTCGISAQAFESISEWPAAEAPDADFFVVSVRASRALSTELAQRFAIRHESPQALVIENGKVVWHGSHFRATAESIGSALDRLAS